MLASCSCCACTNINTDRQTGSCLNQGNQEEQRRGTVEYCDSCVPAPAEVRSSEEGLLKVLGAFEAAEGLSAAGLDKVRVGTPACCVVVMQALLPELLLKVTAGPLTVTFVMG